LHRLQTGARSAQEHSTYRLIPWPHCRRLAPDSVAEAAMAKTTWNRSFKRRPTGSARCRVSRNRPKSGASLGRSTRQTAGSGSVCLLARICLAVPSPIEPLVGACKRMVRRPKILCDMTRATYRCRAQEDERRPSCCVRTKPLAPVWRLGALPTCRTAREKSGDPIGHDRTSTCPPRSIHRADGSGSCSCRTTAARNATRATVVRHLAAAARRPYRRRSVC
jgi:hypothetical protein